MSKELEQLFEKFEIKVENKESSKSLYSILIVDDDPSLRRGLKAFFSGSYNVVVVDSGIKALEVLEKNVESIYCIILDIKMNGLDGFATYRHLKKIDPEIPIIFYSAFQAEHNLKDILNNFKPFGYLDKGDKTEYLFKMVSDAVNKRKEVINKNKKIFNLEKRLSNEAREIKRLRSSLDKRKQFQEIIGNSQGINFALDMCRRASNSDIPVLLRGETGTGKELLARSIHLNSERRNRPFCVQNCAAIPDGLLFSELFGHEKGAFTGAVSSHKGVFEQSNFGTIFLDEIGDMSISMQTSLLRVLQEMEIKPLGSNKTIKVNVRIISATNKNLEKLVEQGKFREDLYYRINIFPITLPPLRERKEDIPILIRYFIKKYREINPRVHNISKRAIQILLSHNFPGNIRELRNIIMRAMALVDNSNTIEPEHLIFGNSPNFGILDDKNVITVERRATLKKTVEELERQLIVEACKLCNGNKSQVAETLGLSRVGLNKKLTRYNIFC